MTRLSGVRLASALRSNTRLARQAVAVVARPRALFETSALVVLGLCGLLALIALDAVVRYGLWGEFAFAMMGCSLSAWGLGRFVKRRLPERFHFIAPRLWQTPIWAAVPLVGIPFAALTRPWGIVVLGVVLGGLLIILANL